MIPDRITIPETLPISTEAERIVAALQKHQVLVVAGDTGSGKTTQLPKLCLKAGYGRRGLIGHTQPRRLAAVSVANRIAEELGTTPGAGVAWQIRFDERISKDSYLKVMTDGILLAELQGDRDLHRYEVIIIDEAHERSLNIDFLLGYMKKLLPRRPELKLIITSATIDVEKFARHFNGAPIVTVSGRGFPVDTRYAPLPDKDGTATDELQLRGIRDAVVSIINQSSKTGLDNNRSPLEGEQAKQGHRPKLSGGGRDSPLMPKGGDILVFLSSEREIRETAAFLRKQKFKQLEILPLYARLRRSEQQKIFHPGKARRVVLATNVAETSLTVPGIVFVIDAGCARISRYSLHHKVQRLPIEPVSRASADQRKGRCGRVAPGVCIRLYSEEDYRARPEFTDPEIQRTNLAAVILRMLSLGLGAEVMAFPFIDPPQQKAVNDGFRLLSELNAIDSRRRLTESGKLMARLPTDPRLGAMLVNAARHNALREMLIIVSALSCQDPREQSSENREAARRAWQEFSDERSDFLSFVKLWERYEEQRQRLDKSQLRKYCRRHHLSLPRMVEWRGLHIQLSLSCQRLGLSMNRRAADYEAVHRCIIAGSLNQVARHDEGRYFLGSRSRRFRLFPGSVLHGRQPKWIVTGELIETEDTFAALAARIEPGWVEEAAMHLVKRECFGTHWSTERQSVMAYQKVSLFGLVLLERKSVDYTDEAGARDIFIREALMAGGIKSGADFLAHNRAFIARLEEQEKRLRKPEVIISERDISRFYDEALPEGICSTAALEQWLQGRGGQPMHLSEARLHSRHLSAEALQAFPDEAAIRHNRLQIDYVFEPGAARDGATLKVPLSVLGQLTQGDVDWAVPGLLRERCIALLKGLPKNLRKHFIPVSGFVDRVLPQMHSEDGDLLDALLSQVRCHSDLELSRADFSEAGLPSHLQIKIAVLDDDGRELAADTGLQSLQEKFGHSAAAAPAGGRGYGHDLEGEGYKDWPVAELPGEVTVGGDRGLTLVRYPALVDRGDHVNLQLHPERQEARRLSRGGVLRLCMLQSVQQHNRIRRQFAHFVHEHGLLLASLGRESGPDFAEQALTLCYQEAFGGSLHAEGSSHAKGSEIPTTREEFQHRLEAGKRKVLGIAQQLEALLSPLLKEQHRLRQRLKSLPASLSYLQKDIEGQLNCLFAPDFLLGEDLDNRSPLEGEQAKRGHQPEVERWGVTAAAGSMDWLQQYPRYLQAIALRLEKAPHPGPKDRPHTEQLAGLWQRYEGLKASPARRHLRWMLEEYRVSLFAQGLGTRFPVSEKRIEKQFQAAKGREKIRVSVGDFPDLGLKYPQVTADDPVRRWQP